MYVISVLLFSFLLAIIIFAAFYTNFPCLKISLSVNRKYCFLSRQSFSCFFMEYLTKSPTMSRKPPNPYPPTNKNDIVPSGKIADLQSSVFSLHQANLEMMRHIIDINKTMSGMSHRLNQFNLYHKRNKALDIFLRNQVNTFSSNCTMFSYNLHRNTKNYNIIAQEAKSDVTHMKDLLTN